MVLYLLVQLRCVVGGNQNSFQNAKYHLNFLSGSIIEHYLKTAVFIFNTKSIIKMWHNLCYSWPSRAWKKNSVGILSTFWHPCSKCILMCFKKDRGGCQVWKCPKVPELGQRSTECKFLYIRQILAFLSISYPKLWFKVMQNLFSIIQPRYINKQHHQGMMCVWIKGYLSAKLVKIVVIFCLYRGKIQIWSSLLSLCKFLHCYPARCVSIMFGKQWMTKFHAVKYS